MHRTNKYLCIHTIIFLTYICLKVFGEKMVYINWMKVDEWVDEGGLGECAGR
jgi:hypothetical protein